MNIPKEWVKISAKSFNMDMDIYLAKRSNDKKPKKKKSRKDEEQEEKVVEVEEIVEDVEVRQKKGSFLKRLFDAIFGEGDDYPEIEVEEETVVEIEGQEASEEDEGEFEEMQSPKKKGKSFFAKLFAWLEGSDDRDAEDVVIEAHEEVSDDLKDALKIQNKWMKKLSSKNIKEFKESGDYERYKEILEKYDLIRKD